MSEVLSNISLHGVESFDNLQTPRWRPTLVDSLLAKYRHSYCLLCGSRLLHAQRADGTCCCDRDPLNMGDLFIFGEKLTDYLFEVLIFHPGSFFLFEILADMSNITLAIKRVMSLQLIFCDSGVAFHMLNLGVTFDNKLNWKNHMDNIASRIFKRISVLKRLAGSKWGCARSTLNITYQKYILPIITYSCESLVTAQPHTFKVLEHAQNQALRQITGAVKTTPIDAMTFITDNKPT